MSGHNEASTFAILRQLNSNAAELNMDYFSSSSSDEEDILLNSSAKMWYLYNTSEKRTVHPLNKKRLCYGEYHHLYQDLRKDSDRFFEYMRMKISTFDYILNKLGDKLDKTYKNCHSQPIGSEEKLMITLR